MAIGAVAAWFVYRMFKEDGPTVGPFRFVVTVSERKDADMGKDIIKLKVGLPASTAGDVVKRELTIKRADDDNGRLPSSQIIPTAMMEVEFEAVQDTDVTLSCVAIDDAGNRSEPKEITFAVAATIAPELSGDFSVAAIGERTIGEDDEPAETPAETEDGSEIGPDELGAAEAEEGEPTGEPKADTSGVPGAEAAQGTTETLAASEADVTNS